MRIYSMTATFGKLEHATLTLEPGLNILQAPNEWGKSTWCAFLVAMLYGIDSRAHSATKAGLADKTRFDPWSGQLMAGRIELCWQGRDITIERTSTKRSQFRQFRAFETASGLPVAELTGENCGELLLGVEKEVFQRSAFIRLSDMPVTQNEALRRRLNALVTTGDESGQAELLANRLNKLKNECRANRSHGLLPQAQAQAQGLEDALAQLDTLGKEAESLNRQRTQLEQRRDQLLTHKAALEYAAGRERQSRLAAAVRTWEDTKAQVAQLTGQTQRLPAEQQLRRDLRAARGLRERWEAARLEQQMLPDAPEKPAIPAWMEHLTEEQLREQVAAEEQQAKKLAKRTRFGVLDVLWLLLLAGGIAAALLVGSLKIVGLALAAVGLVLAGVRLAVSLNAAGKVKALKKKYGEFPSEGWLDHGQKLLALRKTYEEKQAAFRARQASESVTAEQLRSQLHALTGGETLGRFEQQCADGLAVYDALAAALREQQRWEAVVQGLDGAEEITAPTEPDSLTYSPADTASLLSDCEVQLRQVHQRLGHCQGQMAALGDGNALKNDLAATRERIEKLEKTYAALELAQTTLAAARAKLQSRFAPPIAKRAKQLFADLTDGRYDRLSLTEDLSLLVGAEGEDALRSILWRSEGTVDQLYLALRLAVARELMPCAPLVLDDALVRFDDGRLQAAMKILKQLAEDHQVLLFTCQSREAQSLKNME